ncbi:glycosyltransferase family 4 protein [Microbacterium trichothecenolyticum]|uniref:Glycosyltransferase family 4 protein n=2 Tax=Microbacteriaceae TaxID=85023 RepID=A0ABS7I4I9_9MICO|nr:glycosyltransferase family 4 protein [Microbacterium ureisolvens]MBW9121796.1 glycosyltransferase family 4 protein [Microbacterium trichothecenolyticum]
MRVGMLAPIAWRTPPVHYGPWELIASMLTEGLVGRGVEVTLFATADSLTSAQLDAVAPRGYSEDPGMDGRVWEALHVARAIGRSADFDLIHNHLDWLPLALHALWEAPVLTTVHGFSGPGILPAYERSGSDLVSISDADRAPGLRYVATIPHGVDIDAFPLGPGGDDLVVFSRMHPDKGIVDAIDTAARVGRRVILCGIVQDAAYFRDLVLPRIDDDRVVYLGAVTAQDRSHVLGGAGALLHPVHFDEPFGLAVVEAMACGTPVVAYARGAMPEVVDAGVTGILVDPHADDLVARTAAAVDAALALDRGRVRERARRRFDAGRMVDAYLDVYLDVVTRRGNPRQSVRARAS